MKRPVPHTPDYAAQLPPQDLPLEAAILGAALLEAPAVRKAQELLPDEQVFYAPNHIAVWQAIRALSQEG